MSNIERAPEVRLDPRCVECGRTVALRAYVALDLRPDATGRPQCVCADCVSQAKS